MSEDCMIWLRDMPKALGVEAVTVRRMRAQNRLPEPDVAISQRVTGWRLSTLHAAGIRVVWPLPASQPTPEASAAAL